MSTTTTIEAPLSFTEGAKAEVKKLIEQLVTWQPGVQGKKLKMDAVMALWFCEIVARETLLTSTNVPNFINNQFTPRGEIEARYIINLDDLAAQQRAVRL